ncbi:hypothetical protein DL93DRAFT_1764624 [Clavulina sp. PMI_390]|nr:hypothetical protein DL93DRAFT_1764624 [Clavulina sp. PMI_390]
MLHVRAPAFDRGQELILLDLSHAHDLNDLLLSFSRKFMGGYFPVVKPHLAEPCKLNKLSINGYVDSNAAYGIISRAHSLCSLSLATENTLGGFVFPARQISMPSLQFLDLGPGEAIELLPHIIAPNVLSLRLSEHFMMSDDGEPVEHTTIFPLPSQFPHIRSLCLDLVTAPADILPSLLPEFRSLQVLTVQGFILPDLGEVCCRAPSLRVIVTGWMPSIPETWIGSQIILDHWSCQVESEEIPPLSRGFCFLSTGAPSRAIRRVFGEEFLVNAEDLQIGHCEKSPFQGWQMRDWKQLFAKFDADASYLPPFPDSYDLHW